MTMKVGQMGILQNLVEAANIAIKYGIATPNSMERANILEGTVAEILQVTNAGETFFVNENEVIVEEDGYIVRTCSGEGILLARRFVRPMDDWEDSEKETSQTDNSKVSECSG